MKSFHRLTIGALAVIVLCAVGGQAQQQPRPFSPRRGAEFTLNAKKISVDYGSPNMNKRKVVGGLVPYNQVWRVGANQATHLKTELDLNIGGADVPAGTYTLWVWPTEAGWKLIINKTTGVWGTPYKPEYEKTELARVELKLEKTEHPFEHMLITLDCAPGGGALIVEWENTRASVNFSEKK